MNASLGPNTPTSFDPGLYSQEELSTQLRRLLRLQGLANIAGGVEWRDETFEIGIGQLESYQIGPLADQGFSAASNGFPGFGRSPPASGAAANFALYGDLELFGDNWDVGAAVRFEDFEDFGTTINGKLAGRYKFTDTSRCAPACRAVSARRRRASRTRSTCRPSSTWCRWTWSTTARSRRPRGRAAARRRAAEAEEVDQLRLGTVYENGPFTLTVDLFRIELKDRLAVTQLFELTPDEVDAAAR